MLLSPLALFGISLAAVTAQLADPASGADGLERRLSHGHGPERSLEKTAAPGEQHLFPVAAKHHKRYVERGSHRVVQLRREATASATWITDPARNDATGSASPSGAVVNSGSHGLLPAVIAGIAIACVLLLFLLYFLVKALLRVPAVPHKAAPAGFNPAPRPFHSKAASVSTISFTDEKDSSLYKENSEMQLLSSTTPRVTYSPASSDITSIAPHQTFDLNTLPPTIFTGPGSPSLHRSRSTHRAPDSPRRHGTPQLHIPLPVSGRSRSSSHPPPRDESYNETSSPMVHTRSTSNESFYATSIPFVESTRPRSGIAPDQMS